MASVDLSSDAVSFLDAWFPTPESLSSADFILESLSEEHTNLLRRRTRLEAYLARQAVQASKQSSDVLEALSKLAESVETTRAEACTEASPLVRELAHLSLEVARVEKVRIYVQALLQLESSVIDMEEHTAEASRARGEKLVRLVSAVEAFKNTTALAAEIARTQPQWWRLLLAVDLRLDHGLRVIRPSLDQIYRTSLARVKWPPPLIAGGEETEEASSGGVISVLGNGGEESEDFGNSFGTLSLLQVVQSAREERNVHGGKAILDGSNGSALGSGPLWTFQALIEPLAAQAETHLSKWIDQPEFAFALCLKVAQDHIGFADAVLQPLLESAGLVGVSAREEWVKAVSSVLASAHLRERAIPFLVQKLEEDREAYALLWLLTVDQALLFDKQMQKLTAGSSGIRFSITNASLPPTVGVFAERDTWSRTWSRLELEDSQKKAKSILVKDSGWKIVSSEAGDELLEGDVNAPSISGREFKPPGNAQDMVGLLQASIERCRMLPQADQRLTFVESVTLPLIERYGEKVKDRCQEIQGLTSLAHDADLVRIGSGLNGLHYVEQQMHDCGDELFFVELQEVARNRAAASIADGWDINEVGSERGQKEGGETGAVVGSIFDREVRRFRELQEEWLTKIVSTMVRQFDSRTEDYQRNKKRWSEEARSHQEGSLEDTADVAGPSTSGQPARLPSLEQQKAAKRKRRVTFNLDHLMEESAESSPAGSSSSSESAVRKETRVEVSASLVDALAALRSQLLALHEALDEELFTRLWRSTAATIDQLLLDKVVLGSNRFADAGASQLQADLEGLASVFRPFTGRPIAHFRLLSDAVTLLTLPLHALRTLQLALSGKQKEKASEEELKKHGVRRLTVLQAELVLRHR